MRTAALRATILALVAVLGCGESESTESRNATTSSSNCAELEPDNPYSPGTGHHAGFEWAERNDASSCGGNSTSFIEGCEAYVTQQAAHDDCISKR